MKNPEITEYQWHELKTFFRHEWYQWTVEKRKAELRRWMIQACYLLK